MIVFGAPVVVASMYMQVGRWVGGRKPLCTQVGTPLILLIMLGFIMLTLYVSANLISCRVGGWSLAAWPTRPGMLHVATRH